MQNTIQHQQTGSASTNCYSKNWQPNWLKEVWVRALHKRLSTIYQAKFTSFFVDDETFLEWCEFWGEQLADMTAEQIKYALGRMQKEMVWPPNSVEFYQLCKAAAEPIVPMLMAPKVLTTIGVDAMEKIKTKILSKSPGKQWAYDLLERERNGESMPHIATKWAKEVIENDTGRAYEPA